MPGKTVTAAANRNRQLVIAGELQRAPDVLFGLTQHNQSRMHIHVMIPNPPQLFVLSAARLNDRAGQFAGQRYGCVAHVIHPNSFLSTMRASFNGTGERKMKRERMFAAPGKGSKRMCQREARLKNENGPKNYAPLLYAQMRAVPRSHPLRTLLHNFPHWTDFFRQTWSGRSAEFEGIETVHTGPRDIFDVAGRQGQAMRVGGRSHQCVNYWKSSCRAQSSPRLRHMVVHRQDVLPEGLDCFSEPFLKSRALARVACSHTFDALPNLSHNNHTEIKIVVCQGGIPG